MSERDGGPAFPSGNEYDERRGEYYSIANPGMSLRDYFAAKAMQGLMGRVWSDAETGKVPENVQEIWAKAAYLMADQMLRERAK